MAAGTGGWAPLTTLAVLSVASASPLLASAIEPPLARGMARHILLMSTAAPLVAVWLRSLGVGAEARWLRALFSAVAIQAALLYAWHLPAGHTAAMSAPAGDVLMQASLLLAAIWFWLAVASNVRERRWHAVLALAVTGKLFCLLGVVLVFARRPLFAAADGMPIAMADQQLAGLLMLGACPAAYIAVAFVLSCRGISLLGQETRAENARRGAA